MRIERSALRAGIAALPSITGVIREKPDDRSRPQPAVFTWISSA
jgi:hypothetical protein